MLVCVDQRYHSGCGSTHPSGTEICLACGQSLRFAVELHDPGTLVKQYSIIESIGYGSFGAVYQARNAENGQIIALKQTFDSKHIESYAREFDALQHLEHPNLTTYYEHFADHEYGYLVMEYVPGQNLDDVLAQRESPLAEPQVLGYAMQLCDALSYLHAQKPPILHRDIKPGNIRLTSDGLIKLVDFGLLKQGDGFTHSSRVGLTPAYAPIEQYGGNSHRTSLRTDVFSLAATLYHLLTNEKPPTATDRMSTRPDPLSRPRDINPAISRHVSEAIVKGMSLAQNERFVNATEFKQALLGTLPMKPRTIRTDSQPFHGGGSAPTITIPRGLTCPTCQQQAEPGEIYCQSCLHQLVPGNPCAYCHKHSVPVGAQFCGRCGKPTERNLS